MIIVIDSPVPPSMPLSTITAESLIDAASTLLNDEETTNQRWSRTELLAWLNEAQRTIVQLKPGANNKIVAMKLQPGARQMIPEDGWLLMGVTRNMGDDGATPGPMIQLVERDLLDRFDPDWYSMTPQLEIQNYMYNLQDQPSFYVYPPSNGVMYVEVNYSFMPPQVAYEEDVITIRDVYATAILNYMMYRALAKDAEEATSLGLSQGYYNAFLTELGLKDQGENENSPNMKLGPIHAGRGGAK